ncbi:hypothetical protein PTTG_08703 [Puccinia triticina 1-1 BBBD Race 1]|uniref:Uncharacterized protein n=2 Tax=Puccinia triticina TaxID=208348 RepID=A0A0C4F6D7_PUCT1|nr:uncharacterized protein PtA15_18A218 [Puccinia triticina]OAV96757.1 hypothetical protein PTTG_08703 [Puccinia triticina 1-1 BBBD Race 1]WAQ93160.1 hypothetical protein PtA15_18A218 [Puccinia triticina]
MVEKNVQTRAGVAAKRSDTTRRAEVPAAAGMASSTPSTVTGPTTAGVEEEFLSGEEGDEVVSLAIDKSSAVAAGTEIQKAPGASDLASIIAIPNFTKDQVTTIVSSTNSPPVVTVDVEAERAHIWEKIQESQKASDYILTKHLMTTWTSMDEKKVPKPPLLRAASAAPVLATVDQRMIS